MKHAKRVRSQEPPAAIKELVAELNTHIKDKILSDLLIIEIFGSTYPYFYKDIKEKQDKVLLNIKDAEEDLNKPEELFYKVSDGMLGLAIFTLRTIIDNSKKFSPELVKVAEELTAYDTSPIDTNNPEKLLTVAHDKWWSKVLEYLQNGEIETPQKHKALVHSLSLEQNGEHVKNFLKIPKQGNSGEDRAKAASEMKTALDNAIQKLNTFTSASEENDRKFATSLQAQLTVIQNIVSFSDKLIEKTEAKLKVQKNEGRG